MVAQFVVKTRYNSPGNTEKSQKKKSKHLLKNIAQLPIDPAVPSFDLHFLYIAWQKKQDLTILQHFNT